MVAAGVKLVEAGDPPYGLIRTAFTAANGDTEAPEYWAGYSSATPNPEQRSQTRWPGGFYIESEGCGGGSMIDPCGNVGGVDETRPDEIGPIEPLVAEAATTCFTIGSTETEMYDQALRKLAAVRSFQLEREFWTGTAATAAGNTTNQWLTKAGTAHGIENNAPIGYVTALAELEQAIADESTWAVGFIHAMPRTVALWSQNGMVTERRPGVFQTLLGTFVVAGRGYPGTGPGGAAAHLGPLGGQYAFAYATSQVFVRLGVTSTAVEDPALTFDRTTNLRVVRAYQPVTANWDGCVLASALVDHASTVTAIGS